MKARRGANQEDRAVRRMDPAPVRRRAECPYLGGAAESRGDLRRAPRWTYRIEVIDLLKQPQLARGDQIVAVPTLVRHLPPPMKKIIGDLSNEERVLVGLDLLPRRRGTGVRP